MLFFFAAHSPFIVFRERERIKSSLSFHGMLGVFKVVLTFEIWHRLRVRVTKTNSAKNKIGERKNFFQF